MVLETAQDMIAWLAGNLQRHETSESDPTTDPFEVVPAGTAAAALMNEPAVGLDLETTGLDPLVDHVRLLSLASPSRVYLVDAAQEPDWPGSLRPLMEHSQTCKIVHHGKFDLRFLLRAGIGVVNVFDSMLATQLLDGGPHLREAGYFTLAALSRRELGKRLDKALQKSDWSAPILAPEQLRYAASDASVLLPLQQRLKERLREAGLSEAAQLEFDTVPAIAWLENSGAPFDAESWAALSDAAVSNQILIADSIGSQVERPINLNSPKQIMQMLLEVGVKVENTTEEALAAVRTKHRLVEDLLDYRAASKLASTYGIQFLRNVHPSAGRIHASYQQIGAATGRMSCSHPNLQQVPRDPQYRGCFRPPQGRALVKADLSLVELCVAADLACDRRMIQAITEGRDLHRMTAAALFEKPSEEVTDEERAFGKAVNFGTLYGQGIRGLIALAARHGRELTEVEARTFRERFAAVWPDLMRWQRHQLHGRGSIVRSRSGRIRSLAPGDPGTLRVNTPVQGTAADGFKLGLATLWQTRHAHPSAFPVLAIHDELVVECDVDEAENVADWVASCLRDGMRQYAPSVPVNVDIAIRRDWAGATQRPDGVPGEPR
jgi:DNA polymerase-1